MLTLVLSLMPAFANDTLPDPTLLLGWNDGDAYLLAELPDGWKLNPERKWAELEVRWAEDQRRLMVRKDYLLRKGAWVPNLGGSRVHVDATISMCRKDLCREVELSVSGQADLSRESGQVALVRSEWEPPPLPSLDAPDESGRVAEILGQIAAARAQGRIPVLYVWSEACRPCHELEAMLGGLPDEVWSERFALVPIDHDNRPERRFLVPFGGAGTPTLVALAPDESALVKPHVGYTSKREVLDFLDAAARAAE